MVLQNIPIHLIDCIWCIVAVHSPFAIAVKDLVVFPRSYELGTRKFLSNLHESHTLHEQVHGSCQLNPLGASQNIIIRMQLRKQIMQVEIVVGLHVVKDLIRTAIAS